MLGRLGSLFGAALASFPLLLVQGGFAEDVANHAGAEQQRRDAAARSARPEPVGRGRLALPDDISLPELDAGALDRMRAEHGPGWLGPVRSLPPEIGGTWAWTREGQRVWRVTIRATGARALRVRFEGFRVQGSLWMYGDEWNGPHIGPYRDEGPQGDGSFWSAFVFAESVTVEYVPDNVATAPESVPFRIRSVAPILDAGFPVLGGRAKDGRSEDRGLQPRSLAGCHLDVSCYPDLQKRDQPSVAKLHITKPEGTFSCTGFLINPKYESDSRLLLLTAGHCIDSHEVASDVSFLWNWQTEGCYGDPDWKRWAEPLAWTYGATLVVAKDDRRDDFALLVLNKADVREVTGWISKGWTTAEVRTGDEVSTVSHPAGNYKRAAFGRAVNESWAGHSTLGFKTIQWRLGTTERGSSGSPVLKWQDGYWRVVGILSADNAESLDDGSWWGPSCDAGLRVAFSRFDHIYDTIEPYMEDERALLPAVTEPARPATRSRVEVALGSTGETVTLVRSQDGNWRLGGALVRDGETQVRAGNGNVYTLTLGSNGAWSAAYVAESVTVQMGESIYKVTLVRAEDGTWWRGQEEISTFWGTMVSTPDGHRYRLKWQDDRWVAERVSG